MPNPAHRRPLRSPAALAALLVAAAAAALPAVARGEETVYLRGGQVVKGRVIDRGSTIVVERQFGSITLDRKDVIRIEGDPQEKLPPAPEDDLDTVSLRDGKILRGRVTISDDGKEAVISTRDWGEVRHPIDVVKSIRFKNGRTVGPDGKTPVEDPGSKSLKEAIDKHLAALRSPDPKARAAARSELLELAPFAVQYLQGLLAKDKDPELKALVDDVASVRELKGVVATQIEERVPNVYELLVSRDAQKRVEVVQKIGTDCPEFAPPLLLHLIQHDPAPSVRTVCVGELQLLKRFEDLAGVLRSNDGQLRLAAALALGDNGIYAGLPLIIDTLRLTDPGLRELANEKLRAYSGREFGFLPRGTDEERAQAIKRWEDWWAQEGPALLKKSLKGWRESEVTEEDRKQALAHWRDGNKILEEVDARDRGERKGKDEKPLLPLADKDRSFELERAASFFEKALDVDPTLSAARISRAIVLYEELRRPREAEKELMIVIMRFAPIEATIPRKMAHYHLGRVYQLEGKLGAAEQKFIDAIRVDGDYIEARVALGDVQLERAFALGVQAQPSGGAGGGDARPGEARAGGDADKGAGQDPAVTRTTRENAIEQAIIAYRQAIEAVNRREDALVNATKDLTNPAEGVASFPEGRLISSIREDRASLERRGAEIYFRLGRACAARQDERMALEAFRAARRLGNGVERYEKAAALWEATVGKKEAARPVASPGGK